MATRLYPITNNPAILERLAGVPAGTHAKLDELFAKHQYGHDFYEAVFADQNLRLLSHFKTFGWGRVDHRVCPDYSGRETDMAKCVDILESHGVDIGDFSGADGDLEIADLEGLCWN